MGALAAEEHAEHLLRARLVHRHGERELRALRVRLQVDARPRVGEAGEQAVDQPLPGCFSSMLVRAPTLEAAPRLACTRAAARL